MITRNLTKLFTVKNLPYNTLYSQSIFLSNITRNFSLIRNIKEQAYQDNKELNKLQKSDASKVKYGGISSFKNYNFFEGIEQYLKDKEIVSPSPIQVKAFNEIMNQDSNFF